MRVLNRRLLATMFPVILFAGTAYSSDAADSDTTGIRVYTLPPVQTTAPRIRPAAPRPGASTVLDRAWLERVDPTDLSQALLSVAGLRLIHVGDGVSQTVSVRGLSPDRVAVLVDGRALNTAQGGGVDLQPLDLENIERVEITRGAMGALYGPDALGGVVNLVRSTTRNPGATARVLVGTDERALLRLGFGLGRERWNADVAFRAERFSPLLNGRPAHSEGKGGRARLSFHPVWAAAVEAGLEYREDRRDVPGTREFPTPEAHRDDRYRELSLLARGVTAGPGALDLDVAASDMERRYRDPGNPFGPVGDVHDNRRDRVAASWRSVGSTGTLEGRAEAVRDRLESTASGDIERDRAALALQGSPLWGRWGATLAIRADAIESFGPETTARAGITRTLRGDAATGRWLAVRLGGGTSFRPPTFDDLFWPARAGAVGNPDLQPERSRDLDLGIEARAKAARLHVSAFHSEVRDLIQWTPGPDGIWRPHNVSRARIRGAELEGSLEGRLQHVPVRLDLTFSWLDATDGTDDRITGGKELVGRARYTGFGELSLGLGRWTVASGIRAVSRVPLTAANTKWTEGYALWHGRVRWKVSQHLRIDLEGQNLTDTVYEDIRGYATPGRQLQIGLRYAPERKAS